MRFKNLLCLCAILISITTKAQTADGKIDAAHAIFLKSNNVSRNFYAIDLHQYDQNTCGAILRSFYNAKLFTVTSTLLPGNVVEFSALKSIGRSEIVGEINEIIRLAAKNAASGAEQMLKFKQQK